MAFADPQSITVLGSPVSLPRVGFGDGTGRFRDVNGEAQLTISHSSRKRNRSVVRLDVNDIADDPILDSVNRPVNMSVQLVVDSPAFGFDADARKEYVVALATWLTSSSAANTIKFIGGES